MSTGSGQIKRGAALSYLIIFFNLIAGLIYTPWIIGKIGKGDYGLYVLVISFITYFTIDFGLWQAISRYIVQYRAENKEEKVQDLLGLSFKLYLFLDVFVCIALILVYFFAADIFVKLSGDELEKFKTTFLIAGIFAVLSFPFTALTGVFMSYELFTQIKLFDFAVKFLIILGVVAALFLGYKLYALVMVTAFIPFLINIAKAFYLRKKAKIRVKWTYFNRPLLNQLFSISFWIVAIVIGQLFLKNIAPSILGIFSGTDEIATFSIGLTIDGYIFIFAGALSGLFLPKISRILVTERSMNTISDLMIRVGRIQLYIIGFLIIGVFLLGDQFIVLWVGSAFEKSYYVACLLIAPNLIFLTLQVASTTLLALDKLKYEAIMYLFAAICSVTLSIFLAPSYGSIGVAVAICISMTLFYTIGLPVVYYKVLKINMLQFFKKCIAKIFILFLVIIGLFLLIETVLPANKSVSFFLLKGVIFTFLYFMIMYLASFNLEERNLVFSIFKKFKR